MDITKMITSTREIDEEVGEQKPDSTSTSCNTEGKYYLSNAPSSSSSSRQWASVFRNPRIVRASRSFGGKDRHSKVCTARGLRDRRIRLSVPTAIQLYDLQERLGLNQPSKVIDWLLEASRNEIDKLPPLEFSQGFVRDFPKDTPPALDSDEERETHQDHEYGDGPPPSPGLLTNPSFSLNPHYSYMDSTLNPSSSHFGYHGFLSPHEINSFACIPSSYTIGVSGVGSQSFSGPSATIPALCLPPYGPYTAVENDYSREGDRLRFSNSQHEGQGSRSMATRHPFSFNHANRGPFHSQYNK